ncbi:MAG: hypothetical protein IIW84_11180, partial [Selenomonadaceae bacterium]|nr:hypothetical protein [Selenomonadaceae bacterium]
MYKVAIVIPTCNAGREFANLLAEIARQSLPIACKLVIDSAITIDPEVGPQLLRKLSFASWEDMYAAIGYGGLTALKAVGRIRDDINRALKAQTNEKVL